MRRLIAAVLVLVGIGTGVGAQGDTPVMQLFEIAISDDYGSIESVKWSPDGRYIAAQLEGPIQADGTTFRVWFVYDAVSGERISNGSTLLIWYANGQRALVSNNTSKPTSWDLRTGEVFSLRHSSESMQHYRPDELIYGEIVLLESGTLHVYDASDGTLKFTRTDIKSRPMYSPDQTHTAIETSDGIELYETAAWTLIDSLPAYALHMPWLESPVWSGDNRHLIVHKGEYRLAFQPTFIWTVGKGLSAPIFNIDSQVWWAPDGTLMAEANDGEVRFFDSTTGERLSVIRDLPVGTGLPMGGGRILSVSGHYMVTMHGTYAGQALQYAAVTDMETGQVLFQQRVGIAHLAIQGDTLLWFEIGLHAKFIDLAGKTASVVHPIPYIYSALNTGRGWVLAIDGPFSDAARVVLYRLVPFTEYTLIVKPADNHNLNAKWSPDGRRFAVFGGNETTLSVWEIAER